MTPKPPENLDERLARLETSFGEMRQQVIEIGGSVRALTGEFQASRRPQWQLLATFIGLLFTAIMMASAVLALAGKAQISPLQAHQLAQASILDRHDRRIESLMTTVAPLDARFTEVETQFRSLSHLANHDHAEQERLMKLLWRRTYGEELPGDGNRPVIGKE